MKTRYIGVYTSLFQLATNLFYLIDLSIFKETQVDDIPIAIETSEIQVSNSEINGNEVWGLFQTLIEFNKYKSIKLMLFICY